MIIGIILYSMNVFARNGVPKGIRTPVAAVKGRCPRPLDDGDKQQWREVYGSLGLAVNPKFI